MNQLLLLVAALAVAVVLSAAADAHEMRPAYLALEETQPGEFSVLWKVPAMGDERLGLYVQLPATCKPKAEPVRSIVDFGLFGAMDSPLRRRPQGPGDHC